MPTKLTAILLSLACGALLFAAPGESAENERRQTSP